MTVWSDEQYCGRRIDEIIIHCSATMEGRTYTVEDIDRWHRQRGYDGIGYHYVIYLDGSIHPGRPLKRIGAHCKGHNTNSIGICYIGGLDGQGKAKDTRTEAQKEALLALLYHLKKRWPKARITGHRNHANKDCPCFDALREYKNI